MGFIAIMHFITPKMAKTAKTAIYGHEPYENGSKYSKSSYFVMVEVVKDFSLDCSSIIYQTNSTVGITPVHNFLAYMYYMCRVYCQLHNFFPNIIQSVLVTEAEVSIVQIRNLIK